MPTNGTRQSVPAVSAIQILECSACRSRRGIRRNGLSYDFAQDDNVALNARSQQLWFDHPGICPLIRPTPTAGRNTEKEQHRQRLPHRRLRRLLSPKLAVKALPTGPTANLLIGLAESPKFSGRQNSVCND